MRVRASVVVPVVVAIVMLMVGWPASAQRGRSQAIGNGPWTYRTADAEFRVVVITKGLTKPWSMAFLPDDTMLVTELGGRVRVVRRGVIDATPVAGAPAVHANRLTGLMDIALHPRFAENRLVYLTYTKPGPSVAPGTPLLSSLVKDIAQPGGTGKTATTAVWRARWDGTALVEGKDVFVFDNWMDDSVSQTEASRMVFGRDGMLYVGSGSPNAPATSGALARSRGGRAQDPSSHGGKFLRLKDDGTVPPDNPFVGRAGYRPEIFTMGHRNMIGLTVHPTTGAIWETENGPADGDEVNVLKAGANYGWPLVGMGRDYSGDFIGGVGAVGPTAGRADASLMHLAGMEQPLLFWTPAVAPGGMTFYSGDAFPKWKGSLFVAVMKNQRLERIALNENGTVGRREWLVDDLAQRFRDVRQGPDGFLYLLTDEVGGALLRIEPLPMAPAAR